MAIPKRLLDGVFSPIVCPDCGKWKKHGRWRKQDDAFKQAIENCTKFKPILDVCKECDPCRK